MKRVYTTIAVFIISLLGIGINTLHTYVLAAYGGNVSRLIIDWVFLSGGMVCLWSYSRTRSVELLTLFMASVLRSCGGILFVALELGFGLGFSVDLLARFGLFFLLSGVGLFGLLALYFEDSLFVQREFYLVAIPLVSLFLTVLEPINSYRTAIGMFPVYIHNAYILSVFMFGVLGFGVLGMLKVIFSHSSLRYHILVPAYLLQSVLWGVFMFSLPLWLTVLLAPLFLVGVFLYSREIEEFYQP